ncbi:MAG: hypothetical protein RI947_1482 [Candidatus Parcubacteria bacterium]|jgi:uncharacterized cofD-like protein
MKKITVIGGGTGTYVVLSGLKGRDVDLSSIVTMTDSGGSTGRLRDQLGVLPPGDLRQSLVALSEASLLWRKLFLYRFENGDLKGHNFGNIFLSALEKVTTNYDEVIDTASYVLKTRGDVIPVTFEKAHLCVEYESGKIIKEEGNIDEDNNESSRIIKAYLEPKVSANPKAMKHIHESQIIIIGPGDLYTSVIPVLLVDGIKESLMESKAKIVYNLNMMTKSGQTMNYKASDYIRDLTQYIGRPPDMVTVNNGKISDEALEWYKINEEFPVENDLKEAGYKGKVIEEDLIDKQAHDKSASDTLRRSLLRHDSGKLANIILEAIV